MANLGGGARDPPSGLKFLHFHAVFGKIGQAVGWCLPWGLTHPRLENPGSAAENNDIGNFGD